MNCKPNELAFVSHPPESLVEIRGRVVRVVSASTGPKGRAIWSIEGRLDFVILGNCRDSRGEQRFIGESVWLDQVEDCWLTPIRPSGGADETLSWKEVPACKPQEVEA